MSRPTSIQVPRLFSRRTLVLLMLAFGVFAIAYLDHRAPWVWHYAVWRLTPVSQTTGVRHVVFVTIDHFDVLDAAAAQRWVESYRRFAAGHRDSSGNPPKHTFFWSYDREDEAGSEAILEILATLADEGPAEVELRLSHPEETSEELIGRLERALFLARRRGTMVDDSTNRPSFGFVHGMWALDDSRPGYCGVRDELQILARMGAYADFTNPSGNVMHPRRVNSIYWAIDDPTESKSYADGIPMRVGEPDDIGDLLIFAGPSVLRWEDRRVVYDRGDISHRHLPTPDRVDGWVWANIHVRGRPEWIFVRPYMHGGRPGNEEIAYGKWRHRLHDDLEARYDDGREYQLHYVTAREAYNIAMAAADGRSGNPEEYRNYLLAPPAPRSE